MRIIDEESNRFQFQVQSQLTTNRIRYFKENKDRRDDSDIAREAMEQFAVDWSEIDSRLKIVPGKELITALSQRFQQEWNASISPLSLASELRRTEIDDELSTVLDELQSFVASHA